MTINEFVNEVQYTNLYDFDELYNFCRAHNLRMGHGASRFAVLFPKEQMVIKIPRMDCNKTNYCELEVHNYRRAKEYRVERVLLPLEFLTETKSGCLLYTQPMYTTDHCCMSYEDTKRLDKKLHGLDRREIVYKVQQGCQDHGIHRRWMARVIQLYGKRFARSFEQWTKECRVNDLHTSNIGWLDGRPIILDYAGYHGSGRC